METLMNFRAIIRRSGILFIFLGLLSSCEKQSFDNDASNPHLRQAFSGVVSDKDVEYYSETFVITEKTGLTAEMVLKIPEYGTLEDFKITVRNGNSGKTKVSRMEVFLDGKLVITFKDIKGNAREVTKSQPHITSSSVLKIKIEGSKGRVHYGIHHGKTEELFSYRY
jgi:hypothetical protein